MKFTKGELNLANTYHLDLSKKDEPRTFAEASNPFSGAVVKLNALEATLYTEIMAEYASINCGSGSVRLYDRLKYLFLKLNATAYMDLID